MKDYRDWLGADSYEAAVSIGDSYVSDDISDNYVNPFEWKRENVLKVIASGLEPGTPYKWIDFPQPNYASSSANKVIHGDKMVGISMFNGFSYNARCFLSLGVVAPQIKVGDVLTMKWGEPERTGKTSTEAHKQTDIKVRVSETPYAKDARENYADSWRTKAV